MARMRTIKEAVKLIKADDTETGFTEYGLRKMVKNGTFPHVKSGNVQLVNIDLLENYLKGEYTPAPKVEPFERGRVRRISG